MKRLSCTCLIGLLLLPTAPALAQDVATPSCMNRTYAEFGHAERLLRSVILGQKSAANAPIGSVRFDEQRTVWTKTAADTWRTTDPTKEPIIMDDAGIDLNAEFAARKGLLEQRKAMTSQDILPGMLQAFRAFQCHTRAVCAAYRASAPSDAPAVITVQPTGCKEFQIPRFEACSLRQPSTVPGDPDQETTYGAVTDDFCNATRLKIVEHEYQSLLMLATYDASYRTLLQIAGMFGDILSSFRVSLLTPLWQTMRIMDRFEGQTCFNAQCDE